MTDAASPSAAPTHHAAADQASLVNALATAGSCGGCKASAALADSLTCSSCAKPYGEVGLIPRGGWATVRQLMWYAVFATMYISWLTPAFLRGVWLRVRGDILDQEGADRLGGQVRVILNWERDLL